MASSMIRNLASQCTRTKTSHGRKVTENMFNGLLPPGINAWPEELPHRYSEYCAVPSVDLPRITEDQRRRIATNRAKALARKSMRLSSDIDPVEVVNSEETDDHLFNELFEELVEGHRPPCTEDGADMEVGASSPSKVVILSSKQSQFLLNLQELLDLESLGEPVVWPPGYSSLDAKALISSGELPPSSIDKSDVAPPPRVPSVLALTDIPSELPVVQSEQVNTSELPSTYSSTEIESNSQSIASVEQAISVAADVTWKGPTITPRGPRTSTLRSRFAFGRNSEDSARSITNRDSKSSSSRQMP